MRALLYGPVPWLLPGILLSLLMAALGARWLGRRMNAHPIVAFMLIASFGLIVATTLTPVRWALDYGIPGPGTCEFRRMSIAPLEVLLDLNDTSLNVWMFVPFGLAIGLVPRSRAKAVLIGSAIALPFAIELIQLLVPVMGRGCQSADVIDNLTGLAIGLVIGLGFRAGLRVLGGGSRGSDPTSEVDPRPAR